MSYAAAAMVEPLPQVVVPDSRTTHQSETLTESAVEPGTYRYRLRAVREPSVLSRVVEMFALRDLIPSRLTCHDCPEQTDEMLIDLVASALTAQQAENIAARMLNIVPVLAVLMENETA